ncbi:MAG: N-acetylmuramoyl-L-alanine amidase, partial [Candidatus Aminicenantes bacterium]|nr:N-acetylmuramoyl-L-alanine amidase [Candidatus Aminicenantes bacterium]
ENLLIKGLLEKKRQHKGHQAWLFKATVLFLAIFSFSIYKNSDFGDYHSLPALPLASTMTLPVDRQPNVPLAASAEETGISYGEYQPFLSQADFSLRSVFGLKIRTIVIDPGHGGEDPGTSGQFGTKEKDITLDIAKRLQQRLSRYDGYQISLTRTTDETLTLESRIEYANAHKADLFVSIHVNNIPNKPYSIIETYYFGPNADRGALSLAEKENSGTGYAMNDFKAIVQKIGNTLKYQEAKVLARSIQRSLYGNMHRSNGNLYDYGVKTAPFIVLLGVDMPSVLTEVTCLSDPEEEQKLNSEDYREDIARYMEEGIIQYLQIKINPNKSEV